MADSAISLPDLQSLDAMGDPAMYVIMSCERAKSWLAQCLEGNHIEAIVETKAQAEAIRVYTVQKQLGKDAELSASEIVRRAERCIGLCIRQGQAEGRIKKRGDQIHGRAAGTTVSPGDFAGDGHTRTEHYAMAKVSDEKFNAVITAGKSEGNLSRANVVRKVNGVAKAYRWRDLATLAAEGNTSHQIAEKLGVHRATVMTQAKSRGIPIPADKVMRGTRHLDHNRILREFVATLESLTPSVDLLDLSLVKPAVLKECAETMAEAMRELRKLERKLKEILNG
jgi:hypothetical protein